MKINQMRDENKITKNTALVRVIISLWNNNKKPIDKKKNTLTFFFFTFGAFVPQITFPIAIVLWDEACIHFNLNSVLMTKNKKRTK